MDKRSVNTLRKIERNLNYAAWTELLIGRALKKLLIGRAYDKVDGSFNSSNSEDFSRLGAAIGNNTYLTALGVADL